MSATPGGPAPAAPEEKTSSDLGFRFRSAGGSTRVADAAFRLLCQSASVLVIVLAVLLVSVLIWRAWLAIETTGLSFFTTSKWDPEPTHRKFGALAFVYGTIVTSVISMLVAVPLGVGTAAFLAEIAPQWLRRSGSFFVEMLAAIPSVVYGFWGLYVFSPALQRLISELGGPDQAGIGLLSAGLVLGIMIIPYVAAVSFDVIRAVPRSQREAALALGATRWQTIWRVVLPYARPGIIGGCFLALGRALGETMAVTMLIGNRPDLPDLSRPLSELIYAKGNSVPSVIANEFTEATYDLYLSVLVELGLVLLLVSVGFSALGRVLIWRMSRPRPGRGTLSRFLQVLLLRRSLGGTMDSSPLSDAAERDGRPPRLPSGGKKAQWIDRLMTGGGPRTVKMGLAGLVVLAALFTATVLLVKDPVVHLPILGDCHVGLGFAVLAVLAMVWVVATMGVLGLCQALTTVPLFLIVGYLLYRGATSLNWDFFTKLPVPVGQKGGGMAHAFYGSALMIGLATAFSVPIGLLTAIYLAEYRSGRLGSVIRFIAEMIGSVPSIVIGIFGYYAVVRPITHNFSGLAGGFALGIMMLPIVIRASEEALKLVPKSLRQASYALGSSHWQTIVRVSVPAALPAIITAIFLSIARVAGETAPLILTAGGNTYWPRSLNDYTPSLPTIIFEYAKSPYEDWHRQAWAAAFVLVSAIMVLNVGIRLLSGKRVLLASQAD
jgi:phosphate transport system permease protein